MCFIIFDSTHSETAACGSYKTKHKGFVCFIVIVKHYLGKGICGHYKFTENMENDLPLFVKILIWKKAHAATINHPNTMNCISGKRDSHAVGPGMIKKVLTETYEKCPEIYIYICVYIYAHMI